jgi:hypothetical protein
MLMGYLIEELLVVEAKVIQVLLTSSEKDRILDPSGFEMRSGMQGNCQ